MLHCSRNLLNHSHKPQKTELTVKPRTRTAPQNKKRAWQSALPFFFFWLIERFGSKIFSYLPASKLKPWTNKSCECRDTTGDMKPSLPLHKKHRSCSPQNITSVWNCPTANGYQRLTSWEQGPDVALSASLTAWPCTPKQLTAILFTLSVDKTHPIAALNTERAVRSPRKGDHYFLLLLLLSWQK